MKWNTLALYMLFIGHVPCHFISQLKYHEDYNKNVKGQWCETPYFEVATARMAMDNLSSVSGTLL